MRRLFDFDTWGIFDYRISFQIHLANRMTLDQWACLIDVTDVCLCFVYVVLGIIFCL